eukprot:CAMPEP_0204186446 /NCGR_PEP_ID=MMETSP0361-20130328/56001_1 /ASSEMBLY_ACC=CAM_ASM_000343 /TAXON_ID=268821 /ORGANISM="Scrippsiella Hangoei, Strain SHTV-5" /LENGTH=143 /DNA_ID=CAMNT_0051146749 /DNA_START=59 /DNA_END=486 /DNA_ORIENTATION=-
MGQFQKLVNKGMKLVVVHGCIIDVDNWGPRHPGGVHTLMPFVGQDVSDLFDGKKRAGSAKSLSHTHSKTAIADLSANSLGTITRSLSAVKDVDNDEEFEVPSEYIMTLEESMKCNNQRDHLKLIFSTNAPLFTGHAVRFIHPT